MRAIKFRAWHKDLKLMREVTKICFDHNEVRVTDSENNRYTFFEGTFELMQFTGLHDRNGKEIFEGDLIKLHDYFITEVFFNDGGFFCHIHNNNGVFEDILFNSNSICEIIGNKWENPELLETK